MLRHSMAAVLCLALSASALAETGLHLGMGLATTAVVDEGYRFFSSTESLTGFRSDLQIRVGRLGPVEVLPYIAYLGGTTRQETDFVTPSESSSGLYSRLTAHELTGGLRLQAWIRSWLGAYVAGGLGPSWLIMRSELEPGLDFAPDQYEEHKVKLHVEALVGLSVRMSPAIMKRNGIDHATVGIDLGIGAVKRWRTRYSPDLQGGDPFSIADVSAASLGTLDLSGLLFQLAVFASFH